MNTIVELAQHHLVSTEEFVEALTGSPNPIVRLRFVPEMQDSDGNTDPAKRPAEREGRLADLWSELERFQLQGYGVFCFINEVATGLEGDATDADVVRIRALPADFVW